jgi:hypothetical protein
LQLSLPSFGEAISISISERDLNALPIPFTHTQRYICTLPK